MKSLARYATHTIRKRHLPILAIVVALGMAMCCLNAHAQSGTGSIQGTVTDSSGAVIPGATIHVVNQATNVATDTKSNGAGFYQAPGLFTGTYMVTTSAPGFKTYTTRIELLVAQNAVINPVMTVGSEAQQVTVLGNAVQLIDTQNGVISSTLENARINQLPMNGRTLFTLTAGTTPGMSGCIAGPSCVNGLQTQGMEYYSDGVTTSNREYGGQRFRNRWRAVFFLARR